jgi:hypothetical protein
MPKVPLGVLKAPAPEQKKIITKSKDLIVFNDKIVNKRTQPQLFNVQAAAATIQVKTTNVSLRASRHRRVSETDMIKLTNDTLMAMNVALDTLPKDFTLLSQMNLVMPDPNPYVMDAELIDSIENAPKSARDFFPSEKDPIYQLDEGNNSALEYSSIQRAGSITPPVDLAPILSNINILNESSFFFGKIKYY